jgi:hypothetical protein
MAAPTEFTLESVRSFMLEKGGKVTNHDLVKHFKQFLTDPYTKGNMTRSPKRLNAFIKNCSLFFYLSFFNMDSV